MKKRDKNGRFIKGIPTVHSKETGDKIRVALTGRKLSLSHIKNLSKSHIGLVGFWKGKSRPNLISEEGKKKISKSHLGNQSSFKGNKASYGAFHMRIHRKYGNAKKCENLECDELNVSRFEWANISGNFASRDDYLELCVRCHKRWDAGIIRVKTINRNYGKH